MARLPAAGRAMCRTHGWTPQKFAKPDLFCRAVRMKRFNYPFAASSNGCPRAKMRRIVCVCHAMQSRFSKSAIDKLRAAFLQCETFGCFKNGFAARMGRFPAQSRQRFGGDEIGSDITSPANFSAGV